MLGIFTPLGNFKLSTDNGKEFVWHDIILSQTLETNVYFAADLSAVKQWQFQPAIRSGQAVMRVATLKIVFSIDSFVE